MVSAVPNAELFEKASYHRGKKRLNKAKEKGHYRSDYYKHKHASFFGNSPPALFEFAAKGFCLFARF